MTRQNRAVIAVGPPIFVVNSVWSLITTAWFRLLAKIRPVVDGEWSQYQSPWEECFVSSPTTVPKYLAYLKAHNVGLVAWSLQPGSLLKGIPGNIPANNNSPRDTKKASNMREPSRFSRDYACNNHFGQGAGALIKQYFINNAQPL